MKKTLSALAILGALSIVGTQCSYAFDWSMLNPAYWGHCPRCEKKKPDCSCKKKCDPCNKIKTCDPCEKLQTPCPTGAAAPATCDPCDRLQKMSK